MNKKFSFLFFGICLLFISSNGWGDVIPTSDYMFFRGEVRFNGQEAPIGTIVDAFDPDGKHCGTWQVDSLGYFGMMPVYGDDFTTGSIDEGAENGDLLTFRINDHLAVVDSGNATWYSGPGVSSAINLSANGVIDFELLPFEDVVVIQPPDTAAHFTVGVKNLGDGLDFYGVSSSSARGWLTIDMADPAYANPNDTAYVFFDVYIDVWDTLDVDTISFSVFSHLDATNKVDAAYVIRGFGDTLVQFTVLTPAADSAGNPSETISFSVEVQNDNPDPMFMDFYGITAVSQHGWSATGAQMRQIGGQTSGWVNFDVTIPSSVSALSDSITYTLFSHLDPSKTFESSVKLDVILSGSTIMTVTDPAAGRNDANAGDTVTLLVGVRNDGSSLDIYSANSSSAGGWTTVDQDSAFNSPGNTVFMSIDVIIPDLAFGATDTIDYTVASVVDPSQTYSSSVVISTVTPTVAFSIYSLPSNKQAAPGDALNFSVGVKNVSQITDSYRLTSLSGAGWTVSLSDSIYLNIGDSALLSFTINVPLGIPNMTDTITYTVNSYYDTTVSYTGSIEIAVISTGVDDDRDGLPTVFAVEQNYPNPFNPGTTIRFSLPGNSNVNLSVFNLLGQIVETVDIGNKSAGEHLVEFDGSRMASGVYFYRIETDFGAETRKMVMLK